MLLRKRVIEFADIACDFAHIEVAHAFWLGARLGARDHQERIEDADETVGFFDDLLQCGALFVRRTAPA